MFSCLLEWLGFEGDVEEFFRCWWGAEMNVRRTFQPEGTGCTACKCRTMCERTQCV